MFILFLLDTYCRRYRQIVPVIKGGFRERPTGIPRGDFEVTDKAAKDWIGVEVGGTGGAR